MGPLIRFFHHLLFGGEVKSAAMRKRRLEITLRRQGIGRGTAKRLVARL